MINLSKKRLSCRAKSRHLVNFAVSYAAGFLDSARNDSYDTGNLFMKRAAIFYWLIGTAIAAIAIGAAFYLDDTVWHFVQQHQNPTLRNLMRNVSRFGDWPAHVALGLLLLGIAWWRGSKRWTRIFLSMLLAIAIVGIAGHVIKHTVPHAFPSGHVAASTAFFGVLIFARRRVGLACLPIPILIGFSRMYIGAHYLSDVVCAAVLGIFCAAIVARIFLSELLKTDH